MSSPRAVWTYIGLVAVCAGATGVFLYLDAARALPQAVVVPTDRVDAVVPVAQSVSREEESTVEPEAQQEGPSTAPDGVVHPAPVVEPRVVTPPPVVIHSIATPTPPARFPWKPAITTVFWVGEGESEDNGYIHNRASAWDEDWVGTFGGVDDPDDRCGYSACGFTPRQSPFYIALPYYEYTDDGYHHTVRDVPWYTREALEAGSLLHGRWVAVRHGDTTCYGQWRDVGPFELYDFAYVFGNATTPKNTEGERAGLDVSPAMRDCLHMDDVANTEWRFVEEREVPAGPWREYAHL